MPCVLEGIASVRGGVGNETRANVERIDRLVLERLNSARPEMWSTVASNPEERQAFKDLLDEYFEPDRTRATTKPNTPKPTPTTTTHHPPTRTPYFPPAPAPQEPEQSTSTPSGSFSTRASNFAAKSALQNTTLTSSALRNAGFSPGAATAASKLGSKHAEVLAPHLATAAKNSAKEGWNQREGIAAVAAGGAPPPVKPKGPQVPTGLMSSKSIAGGFSTESGKAVRLHPSSRFVPTERRAEQGSISSLAAHSLNPKDPCPRKKRGRTSSRNLW